MKNYIWIQYGATFLEVCDFMLGSPTVLANKEIESKLRDSAKKFGTGLYVPSGALWGGEDIRKMSDLGTLKVYNISLPSTFYSWIKKYRSIKSMKKFIFRD